MKSQKGAIKISTIILIIILMCILVFSFKTYKKNYFNGFEKAVTTQTANTIFMRDSNIKYSENNDSYKIENIDFNDSLFYKEIEVEPNTPYKLSCMIKTENVKKEVLTEDGGVSIGILGTTESTNPIEGTSDWQLVEFMFKSNNREKVEICFRLGGNQNNCTGAAWFSDFKLEKGTNTVDSEWNIGCFIINTIDVNIEGKQYTFNTNLEDKENIRLNLSRFQDDCYEYSNGKMTANCDIIEVEEPITTISFSEEHGYYLSYIDVKNAIYNKVKQNEYDHVFVVCRMENEEGTVSIPINNNWIGLGGMDIYGIGYSQIRINQNSNKHTYRYGITNQAPEEVFLHEFLHTLERNLIENNYEIPELHDNEKYGYNEEAIDGLMDWYKDYMREEILDENTGKYIGLDEICYTLKPVNSKNFKYAIELEFNKEPENIFEEILTVLDAFKKK